MNNNTIPRMRTAKKAIEELKIIDPNTAFSERALRRMIANGEIPTLEIGNRKLVNFDNLLTILSDGFGTVQAIRVS